MTLQTPETPVRRDPAAPAVSGAERPAPRRARLLRELNVSGFVRRIAGALDFWSSAPERRAVPRMGQVRDWCRAAFEERGRIAALMAIAKVADAYRRMDAAGKDSFFALLRDEFSVDDAALQQAIVGYEATGSDGAGRGEALVRLSQALESPRLVLFEQFNTIPSGIKFLVDLRADLVERLARDPELAPIEYELRRKLSSFFNLGFLQLQRIGWESPAALLENLMRYEAVNRITTWDDLKHRLVSDRAAFAFLHPAMPCEPVIFVEVALVQGMADNIQRLLDPATPDLRPDQADTAIFYGISNAQRGLRGIQFGNLLIKQVVARLHSEVPNLETFATLSPLPRFRGDYLDAAVADGSIVEHYEKGERERLRQVAQADSPAAAVRELLAEAEWFRNEDAAKALRPGLLRAARHYLFERTHNGHAACPVAHFHGSNGARLERINWLGDTSEQGMRQSAGIMANYLYDLVRFEKHQSDYLRTAHVAVGRAVKAL
jgi:malonyl-CoA decarboxylase